MYWLLDYEQDRKVREDMNSLMNNLLLIKPGPQHYKESIYPFSGRKCYKIAGGIIKQLSAENDVVYDPFMGSGTFIFATQYNKRKIITSELDPFPQYMNKVFFQGINLEEFKRLFNQFSNLVFEDMEKLYETYCVCGERKIMQALYFDYEPSEYKRPTPHVRISPASHNVVFVNKCKNCGKSRKVFDDNDQKRLYEISRKGDFSSFPNHELIVNSRINITAGRSTNYSFFFTNRQKVALIKLSNALNSLPNTKEKDALNFIFLSILNLSKITDYRTQSQDLYYIPNIKNKEQNIWYQFRRKFNKFIQAIENVVKLNESCYSNPVTCFNSIDELIRHQKHGVHFIMDDYRTIQNAVEGEIDLILTDPPYTDQVPYLERSQLFYPWIGKKLDDKILEKEIVISNANSRKSKDRTNYWKDIDEFFMRSATQLKVHKYMVLYFKPSGTRWLEDLNYFKLMGRKHGLEPIQTIDVSKQDPPKRKVASATWSFAKELLLVFLKVDNTERYWFHENTNVDKIVYESALHLTEELGKFKLADFQRHFYKILKDKGFLQLGSEEQKIRETLKRYCSFERGEYSIDFDLIPPFTEMIRQIDVEQRIFDYTPEVVELLFNDNPNGFTYPDFLMKLSLYLDNGEKEVIKILEENGDRKIRTNLLNFVEDREGLLVRKPELDVREFARDKSRTDLHSLSGEEFENLIKLYLEGKGFSGVFITASTGDRGVDVVANKSKEKYVIQCKRWKNPVNATPIQRIDSFRKSRNADHAWVITTSYYTRDAKSEARITGTSIIDGEEIRSHLDEIFPGEFY